MPEQSQQHSSEQPSDSLGSSASLERLTLAMEGLAKAMTLQAQAILSQSEAIESLAQSNMQIVDQLAQGPDDEEAEPALYMDGTPMNGKGEH